MKTRFIITMKQHQRLKVVGVGAKAEGWIAARIHRLPKGRKEVARALLGEGVAFINIVTKSSGLSEEEIRECVD